MAAVETGPPCHPFRAGLNPAKDNALGSVHNTFPFSYKFPSLPITHYHNNRIADLLYIQTVTMHPTHAPPECEELSNTVGAPQ